MTTLRTFSGTHSWHSSVLNDTDAYEEGNADEIIDDARVRRCPRCERPLPQPPESPRGRGSRMPINPDLRQVRQRRGLRTTTDGAQGYGWGLSSAGCWPIPVDEIDERRARYQQQAKPAILTADGTWSPRTLHALDAAMQHRADGRKYGTAEADWPDPLPTRSLQHPSGSPYPNTCAVAGTVPAPTCNGKPCRRSHPQ